MARPRPRRYQLSLPWRDYFRTLYFRVGADPPDHCLHARPFRFGNDGCRQAGPPMTRYEMPQPQLRFPDPTLKVTMFYGTFLFFCASTRKTVPANNGNIPYFIAARTAPLQTSKPIVKLAIPTCTAFAWMIGEPRLGRAFRFGQDPQVSLGGRRRIVHVRTGWKCDSHRTFAATVLDRQSGFVRQPHRERPTRPLQVLTARCFEEFLTRARTKHFWGRDRRVSYDVLIRGHLPQFLAMSRRADQKSLLDVAIDGSAFLWCRRRPATHTPNKQKQLRDGRAAAQQPCQLVTLAGNAVLAPAA